MIKYYLHKHKRFIKVISITILLIVCLIPVFVSSLSVAADDQYTLTADYICRFNNATVTPSSWESYSTFLQNSIQINLNDNWNWTLPSYIFFPTNHYGLTGFSLTPSDFLSGTAGNTFTCFYVGYVIDNTIYRYGQSFQQNVAYGQQFSIDNIEIPTDADKIIISIQKGSNQNGRYYKSYPIISYTPLVPPLPPTPPEPSEWDYFREFIVGIIGGVVLTFNSLFSLPSKIFWAIVFGVPLLDFIIEYFDNILENLFPEGTDLHQFRPAGYTAVSYEDNHPFDNYPRWFYEHNGGFHW